MSETNWSEDIRVKGEQLLQKIKELIHEGNVRSITIKDKDGNIVFTMPLTFGVIGAVYVPMLAAVGTVAALMAECTITVERKQPAQQAEKPESEEAA